MKWYTLHVQSNYENKVKASIENKLATIARHLADNINTVLVPEVDAYGTTSKGLVKQKQKMYPGYIFIEADMTDDVFLFLKHIPKVLGFVGGTKTSPAPVSDKEMDAIFSRINVSVKEPEYKVTYQPGQSVLVLNGPFKDFSGLVESVNYEKQKLRVALVVFNRSTDVDIEFKDVEAPK